MGEDNAGEEDTTEISPSGTLRRGPGSCGSGRHRHPGRQGRRGPDGEDLESEAVPWTAAWNNSNLRQLDEWAKREDTTRSIGELCGRRKPAVRPRWSNSYCSLTLLRVASSLAAANYYNRLLWLLIGKGMSELSV